MSCLTALHAFACPLQEDIDSAISTYHAMSERWFTHASPTLFNGGTPRPQLSSCFLVCMRDDSIDGIYDTLKVGFLPSWLCVVQQKRQGTPRAVGLGAPHT